MKPVTVLLVLFTNLLFAGSSMFFKVAVDKTGNLEFSSLKVFLRGAWQLLCSPLFLAGVGAGVAGSACYFIMLSRMNLSIAYPLLSLAYLFAALGSIVFLRESIGVSAWTGILFICIGVALLTIKGH
jgi:drug/metabolite transporter (DMT)-like permease